MADENKPVEFKWAKPAFPKPDIYTNFVHTSWTLYDVRFLLGQLIPTEPGVSLGFAVEPQGSVTISWAQAKNLRDVLIALVENYERANGEIQRLKLTEAPEILQRKS